MRITLVLLCLTAGCAPALRSTPPSRTAAELAGCYALEYGAWGPEIRNSGLDSPADLPAAIRLSTQRSGWRPGGETRRPFYEVHALPGTSAARNPFRVWTPVGSDSVWAGVPIQFGGFNLHLVRDGADLRGEAEAYTDDLGGPGPPETRTSVAARRIPCPAP
ncbi:MAG: hypothetical protein AB1941_09370 [Gemmatimonadota bacterium]